MATVDVIVVGGGVSGLSLAWKAASAGKRVLVLEREGRVGGCLHTHRTPDGFWHELGAHSTYNSYGAFLDVVVGTGLAGKIAPRGPARATFGLLANGEIAWLTPPKVLFRLNWLEAAAHLPFGAFARKDGETVYSYYARLVGRRNYDRVLSPFFAAVPSQKADGFPVAGPGSLFKKRPRRKEFPRSFAILGGLQTACEAVAAFPGITVETGTAAARIARRGAGFAVTTADGRTLEAPLAAVAAPPDVASALLRDDFHELATAIARVKTVSVESMGVVLPRARCWMPDCAFVVPVDDLFFSCVTRDPLPDPQRRGFAFHFRPGVSREEKLRRMSEVLRVSREELGVPAEQRLTLPAPALGHAGIVRDVDALLAGGKLAVTGNYFGGLAIEDCVLRSNSEWARIAGRSEGGLGGAASSRPPARSRTACSARTPSGRGSRERASERRGSRMRLPRSEGGLGGAASSRAPARSRTACFARTPSGRGSRARARGDWGAQHHPRRRFPVARTRPGITAAGPTGCRRARRP